MKTFSILLALDLADTSGYAFEQAARLAQRAQSPELHFVYVVPQESTHKKLEALAENLQLYVEEKAAAIGGLDGLPIGVHVRVGDEARAIADVATEVDAAVIVLASRASTRVRSPFRAPRLARKLLAQAPCPVVIAGPRPAEPKRTFIEAACPDCLRVREESNDRVQWCERHAAHHGLSHTYRYQSEIPFESHDSEVIPTGIKF